MLSRLERSQIELEQLEEDSEHCCLCGYRYRLHAAPRLESASWEGQQEPFEELCPECGRVLRADEEPLLPWEEER